MTARHETPGTTTRLIVEQVRRTAGDDCLVAVLARSGVDADVAALVDERSWFTHEDKVAIFDAAAALLGDPDVGRHVGERLLDSDAEGVVTVLRALGSPAAVLHALADASASYCPIADVEVVAAGDVDATVRHRLHDPFPPNRHDCGYAAGILSRAPLVFGLPAAEVDHVSCQVDGADACVYRLRWAAMPKPRRIAGRRARRDHVRGLSARFWELEGTTLDLVGSGTAAEVLPAIAQRAADAVGAVGHLLVLTDPHGSRPWVARYGFAGDGGALVDLALQGLVGADDPGRIVAELASDEHRYGHLVMLFDEAHEVMPEERTILTTYARRAALALDAAAAISAARLREETASALLHLARSLGDLTTPGEVATRLAEVVPAVTGSHQAAVLLYDPAARSLRVRASTGIPPHAQDELDSMVIPLDGTGDDSPEAVLDAPTLVPRSAARGVIAEVMDRHEQAWLALVPIRLRGKLRGMIAAGWRDAAAVGARDALDTIDPIDAFDALRERLAGIADQAATALESATLLEQVRHQALHDALTGLPNQTLFADRVNTEITRAKRNRGRLVVGVLDLDRFKTVNDSLGHSAGDQLLVQVAERLQHAMRAPDTLARMGGDEFTLLLPDVAEGSESIVAERILEGFVQPFEVEGHRLRASPSIGLAAYPDDGSTCEQLLRCADVAMYRAKDRGRNTWARYANGMAERAYDRLTLETDLYRALQRRELRVVYQPIARVADGHVVATEALVRWAHPSLGLLLPEEFLPIAEELGLMAEIDGWVLRQACLALGAATAGGTALVRVAVNLSARTLGHPALERLVGEALAAGGLDPGRLVVEVSEEVTAERVHALGDGLRTLRDHGVKIALDDFGSGLSALSRLEKLPIDQLKVDPMFLVGIDDPEVPAPVVEAIVAMGHGLGLDVVAEGVETDAQRTFATRVGFDHVQGWFVGRPASTFDYEGERSRTA